MKIIRLLILGLVVALGITGCAKRTLSGVYICRHDKLYAKYEFQPNGTVSYKSDLNGQFYHTQTGDGGYTVKGHEVTIKVHGMMDFSQPIHFQKVFKWQGNDLIDVYTVNDDDTTNMDDQDRYTKETQ